MATAAATASGVVIAATTSADIGIVGAGRMAAVARGDEATTTLWRGATTQGAAFTESSAVAGAV